MSSPDTSPNLGLPFLMPAQAQKHVTHNEALQILDLVAQLVVRDFAAQTPPPAPTEGEVWALGPSPTGAWAGWGGHLASWVNGGWLFVPPRPGWRATGLADGSVRAWSGSAWQRPGMDNLDGIGIGTAHDAINRLAVAAPATLLTHAGTDHRLVLNKAGPADTATLLLQSGWSGRAEMGLAGQDDFTVKLSADGTAWSEILRLSQAGMQVTGQVTGTAVLQSATDTTEGRLAVARAQGGIFGLGGTEVAQAPTPNDPDTITRTGFYRIFGSAKMPTVGAFALTHIQRFSGQAAQVAFLTNGVRRFFARNFDNGAWGAWEQYNATLGAVAQIDGVPTGAIIQRGSNTNGEFVRFADGTQICMHRQTDVPVTNAMAGLFRSDPLLWVFPVTFTLGTTNGATVSARLSSENGLSVNVPFGGRTTQASSARAYAIASVASTEIYWLAIGRGY